MLDMQQIPASLADLVQNYSVHIIDIRRDAQIDLLKTDVKQVFKLIAAAENKDKLLELVKNDPYYSKMDEEAYNVASNYTNASQLKDAREAYIEEGGKVNMCKALNDLIADGRAEGLTQGLSQGEASMSKLILLLSKDGKDAEIIRVCSDEKYRHELMKKYKIK